MVVEGVGDGEVEQTEGACDWGVEWWAGEIASLIGGYIKDVSDTIGGVGVEDVAIQGEDLWSVAEEWPRVDDYSQLRGKSVRFGIHSFPTVGIADLRKGKGWKEG